LSEAATRERAVKRGWAEPGSRHDSLIRVAKVALPSAVGVLFAFLVMAPLAERGEVSFILDKKKVDTAPERMRIESARYSGQDDKGQPFVIQAQRAVQPSSDEPIVNIQGMMARLGLAKGPADIKASQGRYNLDRQQVAVMGPITVNGPQGEDLATRDVLIDLKTRKLASQGSVEGRMPLGQFQAGRLEADLGEREVSLTNGVTGRIKLGTFSAGRMSADLDNRVVVLDGGARLKIVQGAIK
jgi:lipopolysaccharide export system protein LptC